MPRLQPLSAANATSRSIERPRATAQPPALPAPPACALLEEVADQRREPSPTVCATEVNLISSECDNLSIMTCSGRSNVTEFPGFDSDGRDQDFSSNLPTHCTNIYKPHSHPSASTNDDGLCQEEPRNAYSDDFNLATTNLEILVADKNGCCRVPASPSEAFGPQIKIVEIGSASTTNSQKEKRRQRTLKLKQNRWQTNPKMKKKYSTESTSDFPVSSPTNPRPYVHASFGKPVLGDSLARQLTLLTAEEPQMNAFDKFEKWTCEYNVDEVEDVKNFDVRFKQYEKEQRQLWKSLNGRKVVENKTVHPGFNHFHKALKVCMNSELSGGDAGAPATTSTNYLSAQRRMNAIAKVDWKKAQTKAPFTSTSSEEVVNTFTKYPKIQVLNVHDPSITEQAIPDVTLKKGLKEPHKEPNATKYIALNSHESLSSTEAAGSSGYDLMGGLSKSVSQGIIQVRWDFTSDKSELHLKEKANEIFMKPKRSNSIVALNVNRINVNEENKSQRKYVAEEVATCSHHVNKLTQRTDAVELNAAFHQQHEFCTYLGLTGMSTKNAMDNALADLTQTKLHRRSMRVHKVQQETKKRRFELEKLKKKQLEELKRRLSKDEEAKYATETHKKSTKGHKSTTPPAKDTAKLGDIKIVCQIIGGSEEKTNRYAKYCAKQLVAPIKKTLLRDMKRRNRLSSSTCPRSSRSEPDVADATSSYRTTKQQPLVSKDRSHSRSGTNRLRYMSLSGKSLYSQLNEEEEQRIKIYKRMQKNLEASRNIKPRIFIEEATSSISPKRRKTIETETAVEQVEGQCAYYVTTTLSTETLTSPKCSEPEVVNQITQLSPKMTELIERRHTTTTYKSCLSNGMLRVPKIRANLSKALTKTSIKIGQPRKLRNRKIIIGKQSKMVPQPDNNNTEDVAAPTVITSKSAKSIVSEAATVNTRASKRKRMQNTENMSNEAPVHRESGLDATVLVESTNNQPIVQREILTDDACSAEGTEHKSLRSSSRATGAIPKAKRQHENKNDVSVETKMPCLTTSSCPATTEVPRSSPDAREHVGTLFNAVKRTEDSSAASCFSDTHAQENVPAPLNEPEEEEDVEAIPVSVPSGATFCIDADQSEPNVNQQKETSANDNDAVVVSSTTNSFDISTLNNAHCSSSALEPQELSESTALLIARTVGMKNTANTHSAEEGIQFFAMPTTELRNPLKSEHGPVLHIYYEIDVLIVVQESLVSFWKYSRLMNLLNRQTPDQLLLQPSECVGGEWALQGNCKRLDHDLEISTSYTNRICMHNSIPIYVEMRCRQLPQEHRECHLLSTYVNIYYYHDEELQAKMHSIQLDTVQSTPQTIVYTTIPESRYFVMAWSQENILRKIRTGLCKYSLTPQLDTLASIRDFKYIGHEIGYLECSGDDRLLGYGDTKITIWDHRSGDVLMNYDLEIELGRNLGSMYFSGADIEQNNMLLLFQYVTTKEECPKLMVVAVSLSHSIPSYRVLRCSDLPVPAFASITNSVNNSEHLVVTAQNDEEIWISCADPNMMTRLPPQNTRRFYARERTQLIELTENTLTVDSFANHVLKVAAAANTRR